MQDKALHSPESAAQGLAACREKYAVKTEHWKRLRAEGVRAEKCPQFVGISKATYHRYKQVLAALDRGVAPPTKSPGKLNRPRWGEAEMQLVLRLRRKERTWGKRKIGAVLRRDFGQTLSDSTVGRILTRILARGLVSRSRSAPRKKRKRNFGKRHARPWTWKKYSTMALGERVQIDHMSVVKNGVAFKHFKAWERHCKFIHARIYPEATTATAKAFLLDFMEKARFRIVSIQVDGGSEFRADFEDACEEQGIPLIVLPPASPTYNGGVERGNRIFREEFYAREDLLANTLETLQAELAKAVDEYNSYRPHNSLDGLTPLAYLENVLSGSKKESHMC